jgi:hypothetical protein
MSRTKDPILEEEHHLPEDPVEAIADPSEEKGKLHSPS